VGYRRLGQTVILLAPKVIRCIHIFFCYNPHFCQSLLIVAHGGLPLLRPRPVLHHATVCLPATLCIVAKRHILQINCLNKCPGTGSAPLGTRFYNFQLRTLTLSPETPLFMNHRCWLHLVNKLKTHCEQPSRQYFRVWNSRGQQGSQGYSGQQSAAISYIVQSTIGFLSDSCASCCCFALHSHMLPADCLVL